VKCTERRKRREASSFLASFLALPARLVVGAALSLCAASCAASAVGSIGAMLGKDNQTGQLFVREVPPGMGAAVAGVREGDEVIAIDGAPVDAMSPTEVHQRLEGGVGTNVVLRVVRGGVTYKITIVRGPLATP
jgi:C-terminal processing protease CtpA/Prc